MRTTYPRSTSRASTSFIDCGVINVRRASCAFDRPLRARSTESAVYSGFRAAEAVLAGMGRHVRMAIAPRAADGLASVLRAV